MIEIVCEYEALADCETLCEYEILAELNVCWCWVCLKTSIVSMKNLVISVSEYSYITP